MTKTELIDEVITAYHYDILDAGCDEGDARQRLSTMTKKQIRHLLEG